MIGRLVLALAILGGRAGGIGFVANSTSAVPATAEPTPSSMMRQEKGARIAEPAEAVQGDGTPAAASAEATPHTPTAQAKVLQTPLDARSLSTLSCACGGETGGGANGVAYSSLDDYWVWYPLCSPSHQAVGVRIEPGGLHRLPGFDEEPTPIPMRELDPLLARVVGSSLGAPLDHNLLIIVGGKFQASRLFFENGAVLLDCSRTPGPLEVIAASVFFIREVRLVTTGYDATPAGTLRATEWYVHTTEGLYLVSSPSLPCREPGRACVVRGAGPLSADFPGPARGSQF